MSEREPRASHVSLIALSQRMRCSHTVVLYNQKMRYVGSSAWLYNTVQVHPQTIRDRNQLTKKTSSIASVALMIRSSIQL